MSYKVKLDIFEGPFDLLVYLIESAEMSIYDIRVSEITTQYLQYIEKMQQADAVVTGEFMVLAAALIEIKSKMLLPRPKLDDSQDALEDPRNELVQKLLEYKRFKAAAEALEERETEMMLIYEKPQEDLVPFTKEPDEYLDLDISQFIKAFHLFLGKKKKLEDIKKRYARVERQRMSIETRIDQIRNFFSKDKEKVSFRELLNGETSRYNIVLTFMSVLELLKQRTVWVHQNVNYGEITLELQGAHRDDGLLQDTGAEEDEMQRTLEMEGMTDVQ